MRGGIVPSKRLHVQGNFEKEFVGVLSNPKVENVVDSHKPLNFMQDLPCIESLLPPSGAVF